MSEGTPQAAPEGRAGSSRDSPAPVLCVTCFTPLPDRRALTCLTCKSPQQRISAYLFRHGPVVRLITTGITGLIFPVSLVVLGTWYAGYNDRAESRRIRYDEVTRNLAELRGTFTSMYEPCAHADVSSCLGKVDEALKEYLQSRVRLEAAVLRHYPLLSPTVLLLESLDHPLAMEIHDVWGEWGRCVARNPAAACFDRQRGTPIPSQAVAGFVLEYLGCAIDREFAAVEKRDQSVYCWAILQEREHISLVEARRVEDALADSAGAGGPMRMHRADFKAIADRIWQDYILPGSGLGPMSPGTPTR